MSAQSLPRLIFADHWPSFYLPRSICKAAVLIAANWIDTCTRNFFISRQASSFNVSLMVAASDATPTVMSSIVRSVKESGQTYWGNLDSISGGDRWIRAAFWSMRTILLNRVTLGRGLGIQRIYCNDKNLVLNRIILILLITNFQFIVFCSFNWAS